MKGLRKKLMMVLIIPVLFFVGTTSVSAAKITYHSNGGSINQGTNPNEYTINAPDGFSFNVGNGASVTGPTGYTFDGWYNHQNWVMGDHITTITLNSGQHLHLWAKYVLENYDISYDLGGGTVDGTNPTTYHYKYHNTQLINPTREGYEFLGWTGTDLTEPTKIVVIGNEMTGDREYTANWEPIEYTIEYDLQGGEASGNPSVYTVESEDIVLNKPTREGFNFTGWTEVDKGDLGPDVTITKGTIGNKKYIANWEPIKYKIDYELDGGDAKNPEEYTIVSDDITLTNPVKEGYEFLGWTGTDLTDLTLTVTILKGSKGDRNYIANWQFIYKITDGENQTHTKTVDGDLTVTCNGNVDLLVGIEVDGEMIDPSQYKIVSGSTILTLLKDYLDSLDVGTHTLRFVYEDGSAETEFTILEAPEKPESDETKKETNEVKENSDVAKTGIEDNSIIWILLLSLMSASIYVLNLLSIKTIEEK